MANFCSSCGTKVDPSWNACPICGTILKDETVFQPMAQPYIQPVQQQYAKPRSGKSHKHSALALIFGVIGSFIFFFPIIGIIIGTLAIIFGLIGLTSDEDNVMAVIGLILGILTAIIGVIFLIIIFS